MPLNWGTGVNWQIRRYFHVQRTEECPLMKLECSELKVRYRNDGKGQRWGILLIWWSPCDIKQYNYFTRDSLTSVFLIFPTRLWSIYRQSMIEHLGPQLSRTQKFKLQALLILFSHWKWTPTYIRSGEFLPQIFIYFSWSIRE